MFLLASRNDQNCLTLKAEETDPLASLEII